MISEEQARAVAEAEARQAYHDLSVYTVTARLEGDAWYVDYELADPLALGGGPHLVVDAFSGEVVARRYEQ